MGNKRIYFSCSLILILSSIGMVIIENRDSNATAISFQSERVSFNRGLAFQTSMNVTQQGMIRIIGTLTYWDYADQERPLVWARVWVCDRELDGLDYILVERFTDLNGQFDSGWIVNDDGSGEDGLDIVFYFVAWNDAVQIIDPDGVRYYAIDGPYENLPDGEYDYDGEMPRGHGAWMMFSYHNGITAGWNYLYTQTGYDVPMVTCRWPYENWPHYHPGGEIHLPDWACWWSDIILHEYGHHVMYSLYGFIPPSMEEHSINLRSNSTTAWAEGWANFFPLVVLNDSVFTWSNGTHYANIDLETPHWCSSGWDDGDEVEGRVAGALWDIYDSQNDSEPWYYDSFSDGFTNIWNIMETTPCNNSTEFWEAWAALNHSGTPGYPKQPALMAIFQNAIDCRGLGDVDGNCIVDVSDLTLVIGGIPSQKGQTGWDKRRDLNNDDTVDVSDLAIVVTYQGYVYDC